MPESESFSHEERPSPLVFDPAPGLVCPTPSGLTLGECTAPRGEETWRVVHVTEVRTHTGHYAFRGTIHSGSGSVDVETTFS